MPTDDEIYEHNMDEIWGLNQRGGRMLSIVDLIERGTVDIDLAACLLTMIHHGASFLCCALHGGVGKTTLMGALLGLLPPGEEILTVASMADISAIRERTRDNKPRSLVVHEIGSGQWYGYLWGKPVVDYIALKNKTTRIVSNIHADTLVEVESQIRSFDGTIGDMLAFDLILFIALGKRVIKGERMRVISKALAVTGECGHRIVRDIRALNQGEDELLAGEAFLNGLLAEGTCRIEDVAARVARHYKGD